jgi:transcriptional regulator with XRE-family HTH domain
VDRLAELRESQALTLRDLAERSGVDANTINQVELGHRKPRPSTLRKLAKALDVEVREFFEEPAGAGKGEAPREAGPALLYRVLIDAALQDIERNRKATNREKASEGLLVGADAVTSAYAEAKVQAELRAAGVSDELSEKCILPLAHDAARAVLLKQENARLEEENARLREGAGQESVHQ